MKTFPQRKSIRLKNYDYSLPGWYYVTICSQDRKCIFGDVVDEKMELNGIGKIVENIWQLLPGRHPAELDTFQIMPNHLHGIIVINKKTHHEQPVGAGFMPARNNKTITHTERATTRVAPTLGDVIGTFKSLTTHEYIRGVKSNGWKPFNKRMWQRNFYEHVIRAHSDLKRIREYIKNNPKMWERDRNNPKNWKSARL